METVLSAIEKGIGEKINNVDAVTLIPKEPLQEEKPISASGTIQIRELTGKRGEAKASNLNSRKFYN